MPGSLKVRAGLLGERRDFRRLFLATLASSIGTWLAFVALVIDVFDRTGSAAWVSALLVAEFLPLVVIGLIAAPLLDRAPRRTILIATDLVRAGVFCVIPFAISSLQIVLLALAAGVATSFFRPAVYAGLPNLVTDAELPRANGLLQSAENATLAVLGSYLAGTWVDSRGVRSLYAASIAVMALGIGAVAASPGVWVAAGLLVVAGFGNGSALVCNAVLMQRGVSDVFRGRAFTLAMSASFAALGLGMIASGPLTDSLGPREVWGQAAALLLVAAPLSYVLTRGVSLAPPGPTREPALPSRQGA